MTNLKKIIDKAVSGGYVCNQRDGYMLKCRCKVEDPCPHFEQIIFSHDFLISIYGKELVCILDGGKLAGEGKRTQCMICNRFEWETEFVPAWQYHGFQQLLSEDRIKYLLNYMEV